MIKTHLHLSSDEERRDTDELQVVLIDIRLSQHKAVEEVLSKIGGLPVQTVNLTDLDTNKSLSKFYPAF